MGFGAIDFSWQLVGFAAAYGLVLLTPGPNLLLVLDAACAGSIRIGLVAALGVACGATALALTSLSVGAFVTPSLLVKSAAEVAFGAIVVVLGVRALRHSVANSPAVALAEGRGRSHFRIAFLTAVTNPFTALFFIATAGVFGAVSLAERATLCGVVFGAAILWFGAVIVIAALALRTLCLDPEMGARVAQSGRRLVGFALTAYGLALLEHVATGSR